VTFVITQPCIDTTDKSCVEVCPVDCIHFEEGTDRMLYINPAECIDCGACEPACPVSAIFEESSVPADMRPYTAINSLWYEDPGSARSQVAALLEGGAAAAPAASEDITPTEAASVAEASAPAAADAATDDASEPDAAPATPAVAEAAEPTATAPVPAVVPMRPKPHASKGDYNKAFAGFHYPISKDAITRMAADKGGLDREVRRILAQIPARKYKSVDEVQEAVRWVYLVNGVPEDALPI
jgi:ferredoxin